MRHFWISIPCLQVHKSLFLCPSIPFLICTCMSPTSSVYATYMYIHVHNYILYVLFFSRPLLSLLCIYRYQCCHLLSTVEWCHLLSTVVESTVHLQVPVLSSPFHCIPTTKILSLLTISSSQMYICMAAQWMQLAAAS